MIYRWVEGINTNSVCLKLLKNRDIALASSDVPQRVDVVNSFGFRAVCSDILCING
jgi:hypothetical protein